MKMPAVKSIGKGRPFVFLNMAMTADGKIASANRDFASFGGERDRRQLMALRATADAVMSGAVTLSSGAITLGNGGPQYGRLRVKEGLSEYPLRIIVSGSASISPAAAIFKEKFSPIVVLATERASSENIDRLKTVAAEVKVFGEKAIDWTKALPWLKRRWKINRLLCEGGGELNASLFEAGMVDELHLTICPRVLGGRNAPTFSDGIGMPTLAEAQRLSLVSRKRHRNDLFLVYRTCKAQFTRARKNCNRSADIPVRLGLS
jgi:riboflavin-specific deaminase-like protein